MVISAAATAWPVSVDELKAQLNIHSSATDDDAFLLNTSKEATEYVEHITGRALLTQTWDYYLDVFPAENFIKLPLGNLQSVTHVKYTNSAGTQTTMTVTTEYLVEINGAGIGRVVLPYGVSWPSFDPYPSRPIVIEFVAGWTAAGNVPPTIRAALKLIGADLYVNREGRSLSQATYQDNETVMRLLGSHCLWDEF